MAEKKNTQMIVKLTSFQDAVKRISDMTRAHAVKSDDHFWRAHLHGFATSVPELFRRRVLLDSLSPI